MLKSYRKLLLAAVALVLLLCVVLLYLSSAGSPQLTLHYLSRTNDRTRTIVQFGITNIWNAAANQLRARQNCGRPHPDVVGAGDGGLRAAKAKGTKLGRPTTLACHQGAVAQLLAAGLGVRAISRELGIPVGSLTSWSKRRAS